MTIQDIINEIFESQDMIDYLCKNTEILSERAKKHMVAASPRISVYRKLEILEWLSENEKGKSATKDTSYESIINNTKITLAELQEVEERTIFLVNTMLCSNDKNDNYRIEDTKLFASYDKILQYFEELEYGYDKNARLWCDIEKWILNEDRNFEKKCSYIMNRGEVIFCHNYGLHRDECTQNKDLNLLVPFKAGDIVEVKDIPFSRKRHTLILDIGDNRDCCSVWQLYADDDGVICSSAFKHGDIFDNWYATSPLYSAKIFHGVLEGEEEVLHILQSFMKQLSYEDDKWNHLFAVANYLSENKVHSSVITEELLDRIYGEVLSDED